MSPMRAVLLAVFSLCLVLPLGCKPKPKDPVPPLPPRDGRLGARRCSSLPGPKNKQVPIFQRPFDKQYPVYYLFDHDTPGVEKPYDPASKELSYCGLEMFGTLEGMEGYSWRMPVGTPVFAAQDGEVVFAGKKEPFYCTILAKRIDTEFAVEVKHATLGDVGYKTTYRSLSTIGQVDGRSLQAGDRVKAGQRIGLSGQSGCVAEPQLLFVVHKLTKTKTGAPTLVDPYGWDYTTADPWEKHERGTQSFYLWMEGEAPTLEGR